MSNPLDDGHFRREFCRRRAVQVDFWAPWCGPSAYSPRLEAMAAEYKAGSRSASSTWTTPPRAQ
jgi:thiol-disulfide isomerase/thioredoxin